MIEGRPTSPPKGEDEEYILCHPHTNEESSSSIVMMNMEKNEKQPAPVNVGSL